MRTPINGARLSSSYGNRKHPILGYTKLHTGTDFAAPRGTPIYAAGNGSVVYAGRKGGYGLYVRIRHNGTYQTAYAHMSGIARGVRKGKRVDQGQVIGYVGTTGRSTGNHLHYEVIRNGKFINSRRMHLPSGKALKGDDLAAFTAMTQEVDARYVALLGDTVLFASTEDASAANCGSAEAPC
jgi:murein DD-endopeptidase MepM/ murein hydrolase activator NlpD